MSAPTPSPPAPEEKASPPAAAPPVPDFARERERDRLLTLANVQRMRGQLPEAQETLKKALALGDGQSKADAPIHEILGDVLASDERWEEAKAAFGAAHALDPERVSAERKFAQMTLRLADAAQERALAEALLRGEIPPGGAGGIGMPRGKRNPGLAMLLSAFVPGFGQLYNGQMVKGFLCLGIFVVTLLAINLSPDAKLFFGQILPLAAGKIPAVRGEISPFLLMLIFVCGAMWLYAVIDAPIAASKTASAQAGPAPSGGDKSGWEV